MHHLNLRTSVLILCLATASSVGASDKELPGQVSQLIDQLRQECSDLDGKLKKGADTPRLLQSDVDGDGLDDYLLDPENMECEGAWSTYCGGSGGCGYWLALSSKGYKDPEDLLGGEPTFDGPELKLWLHHANCDGANYGDTCLATYSWKNGKLEERIEIQKPVQK